MTCVQLHASLAITKSSWISLLSTSSLCVTFLVLVWSAQRCRVLIWRLEIITPSHWGWWHDADTCHYFTCMTQALIDSKLLFIFSDCLCVLWWLRFKLFSSSSSCASTRVATASIPPRRRAPVEVARQAPQTATMSAHQRLPASHPKRRVRDVTLFSFHHCYYRFRLMTCFLQMLETLFKQLLEAVKRRKRSRCSSSHLHLLIRAHCSTVGHSVVLTPK